MCLVAGAVDGSLDWWFRRFGHGAHFDAIHGTRSDAEFTARAALGKHGVRVLRRADDGVDRAGRQAPRAADAAPLVDPGHPRRRFDAVRGIQRQYVAA